MNLQQHCDLYQNGPGVGYDVTQLDEARQSVTFFGYHVHMLRNKRRQAVDAFVPAFLDVANKKVQFLWQPPHSFWDTATAKMYYGQAMEKLDPVVRTLFDDQLITRGASHLLMYHGLVCKDPVPVLYNKADVFWLHSEKHWPFEEMALRLATMGRYGPGLHDASWLPRIEDYRACLSSRQLRGVEMGFRRQVVPVLCAVCSSGPPQKLRACTGCRHVEYCSRECQRAHWPRHKKTCRAIREGTEANATN